MNENYQAGDFGHINFYSRKKGFSTRIDCWGTIKEVEAKFILFQDNDGFEYLISKKDFTFEKCERNDIQD
jgi:hypothetical protein